MAIAFVSAGQGDGDLGTNATTGAFDTTGATLIVIVGGYTITPPTFSDSEGNTWTTVLDTGSAAGHVVAYCLNPSTSATHTCTAVAGFALSVCAAAFSGIAAFDSNSTSGTATAASITTAAVTPATTESLFVSGFATNNNTNAEDASATAPYTKVANAPAQASSNVGSALSYNIQTGSSAADDTQWTIPGSADVSASLMSFAETAIRPSAQALVMW